MSETERLKLPKIDGNMTADVVRDFNALAEAIDEKTASREDLENIEVPVLSVAGKTGNVTLETKDINGLQAALNQLETRIGNLNNLPTTEKGNLVAAITELKNNLDSLDEATGNSFTQITNTFNDLAQIVSEHQAETTQNAHLAKNIGIEDTAGNFTATELEGAMSELFTNVSNGKSLVGGAITDVDPNVVVPTDPTFQDLADGIGQISTGKKWASGTVTVTSSFSITGLNFRPSKLLFYTISGTDNTVFGVGTSDGDIKFSTFDSYGGVYTQLNGSNQSANAGTTINFGESSITEIPASAYASSNTIRWFVYE